MFLLWELSTPFVYARWFLHKAGMSRTTTYKVNGVMMVLVFFLCRNVAGLGNLVLCMWCVCALETRRPDMFACSMSTKFGSLGCLTVHACILWHLAKSISASVSLCAAFAGCRCPQLSMRQVAAVLHG